jgi:oligoribonuclease NrnB/cAMP/cGMP phosphodiesterase (DHH superfamily)
MDFDFSVIDTCIYHKDCCDGFTAAWLVHVYSKDRADKIKFIPATHNMNWEEIIPDITDKNVLIVDFSFKRGVLELMNCTAKSLLIIDHHKTAQKDLEGLEYAIFDMKECGASLLYTHLYPGVFHPMLVDYVKDRDLWNKALPDTRAVNAIIQTTPMTFEDWHKLNLELSYEFDKVVANGRLMNAALDFNALETAKGATLVELSVPIEVPKVDPLKISHNEIASDIQSDTYKSDITVFTKFVNVKMRVISVGVHGLISDTCNFILDVFDDVDIVCSYTVFPDGGQLFSLRSRPSVDCSWIATAYGGGGHAQACGFKRKDAVGFPWRVLDDDKLKSSV